MTSNEHSNQPIAGERVRLREFCLSFLAQAKWSATFFVFSTATLAFVEACIPLAFGKLIGALSAKSNEDVVLYAVGLIFLVLLVRPITQLLSGYTDTITLGVRFVTSVNKQCVELATKRPVTTLSGLSSSALTQRLLQIGPAIKDTTVGSVSAATYVLSYFLSTTTILISLDARLIPPLALWIILYLIIVLRGLPRINLSAATAFDRKAALSGVVADVFQNILTFKTIGGFQINRPPTFDDAFDGYSSALCRSNMATLLFSMLLALNSAVMIASECALASYLSLHGGLPVSAIATLLPLLWNLSGLSNAFSFRIAVLMENVGSLSAATSILSLDNVQLHGQSTVRNVQAGSIRLDNLTFGYAHDKQLIESASFCIQPGQKVGVCGASGSGKSTLILLVMGLLTARRGGVYIGDANVDTLTDGERAQWFSLATQRAEVMHWSIWDNMTFGRRLSSDQVLSVANATKVSDFADTLVDSSGRRGYEAFVGESGSKLSGGQRQRVAVARTLLSSAPILIFDEPTAGLDHEAASEMMTAILEFSKNRTVIVVSHNMSVLGRLDFVLSLNGGKLTAV
jgi:ATP-binding cassette subfamily B multidrug efflux pump